MKDEPVNIGTWAAWLQFKTHNDPQLESMVERVARFIRRFRDKCVPCWLSLLGTPGIGKTHCAQRAYRTIYNSIPSWIGHGKYDGPKYVNRPIYWPALIRDLRNGQRYEEISDMADWPVLFLDDIGAERDTTGFAAEQLNTLLGCRVKRWTILTSNLMLEHLAAIDARIADRMVREPGNEFIEVDTVSHGTRKFNLPFNSKQ